MTSPPSETDTLMETSAPLVGETRVGRTLKKIFSRHLMDMAILLLLPMVLSGLRNREGFLGDCDIWWHLANARILWDSHHVIHVEPYSFTVAGERWVNPEWLSEVPFWLGYKAIGLPGIYLAAWLAAGANLLFLYWRSYLGGKNAGVSLWISAIGFVLMWVNVSSRTILFGYIALSVELAILEAEERKPSRKLWLLPPLFCVWINLHGSWFIGLAVLALYIFCGLFKVDAGIFQQDPFSRSRWQKLAAVFGATLAALMVNPYGWRLVWNPLDMAFNQTLNISRVLEWQPLNLGWPVGKAAVVVIALTILTNALHARKWTVYQFAVVFFAWYAAFSHARFTFLASVITIPMLAWDVTRGFFPPSEQKTIPLVNGLLTAGILGFIAWYFPSKNLLQQGLSDHMPLRVIAAVQPSWRVFNQEQVGGMMDFIGKSTFIDTRWDTFEHHGVMQDYLGIVGIKDPARLLEKYRIDHAILSKNEPIAYVLEHTAGWKVIQDESVGTDEYLLLENTHASAGASSN